MQEIETADDLVYQHSEIDLDVILGTTMIPIHNLLRISRGAVIELDTHEEDEVIISANEMPIAKGTVMVENNQILVAISRMLKFIPGKKDY